MHVRIRQAIDQELLKHIDVPGWCAGERIPLVSARKAGLLNLNRRPSMASAAMQAHEYATPGRSRIPISVAAERKRSSCGLINGTAQKPAGG